LNKATTIKYKAVVKAINMPYSTTSSYSNLVVCFVLYWNISLATIKANTRTPPNAIVVALKLNIRPNAIIAIMVRLLNLLILLS